MHSSFGLIKRVTPREETQPCPMATKPALPGIAVATHEFLRMVGVAALSGLFFSVVAGLLVFLVASHGALDPRPPQEAQNNSATQEVSRS